MKKLRFLGLLTVLLVLALVFAACGGGGAADIWEPLGGVDQLDGAWRGSFSQTMRVSQWEEAIGGVWHSELQEFYGQMDMRISLEKSIRINTNTGRMWGVEREARAYSGGNIREAWPAIRRDFLVSGWNINDSNYSASINYNVESVVSNRNMGAVLLSRIEINQNGKRIRIPLADLYFPLNDFFIMSKN